MRKTALILIAAMAATALAATAPASAASRKVTKRVVFEAPTPCAVACPYWTAPGGYGEIVEGEWVAAAEFTKEETGVDPGTRLLDPVTSELESSNAATCAEEPLSPPGSWDDARVRVPTTLLRMRPTYLTFKIAPTVDYDAFICGVRNAGKANESYYFVASGANSATDCAVGCAESVTIKVKPRQTYVLRVYNWSDHVQKITGTYTWTLASVRRR